MVRTVFSMPPVTAPAEMLTIEDYCATPDNIRYQLIEGDLVRTPSVTLYHQVIVGNLVFVLGAYLDRQPVGKGYLGPLDVFLSNHNVFQPDVLFVAKANFGILKEDGVHGAPDLVIEVLSPSTAQLDKKAKRRVYAQAGVKELWLVDPLLSQIQRYDFARDTAKPVQLIEENETFETPLLPGLRFLAAEIFRR